MTGAELKQEIKKRGFTFRSIAKKLGKSEQNFGRMLRVDHVSTQYVEAVANAMGITVAEIYRDVPLYLPTNTDEATNISRLLEVIQARDRALEKSQEQIDRLLSIIESNSTK